MLDQCPGGGEPGRVAGLGEDRHGAAQGEDVVDVSAKLAARVRVFDTGNARKTDATDAHAVAMVALRTPGLRELAFDQELLALRLLTDRATSPTSARTRAATADTRR